MYLTAEDNAATLKTASECSGRASLAVHVACQD
jgi:hypothetical protein